MAAGGSGLGVAWWQVYDNVRPKELKEEVGEQLIFLNSDSSLDDIPYLSFDIDTEKYNEIFKDGDCIKKYLPGKITSVAAPKKENIKEYNIGHKGQSTFLTYEFSSVDMGWSKNRSRPGYGFKGTEGCLSINIKYNNEKSEKDRGIIGRVELVAWNDDVKEQDENKKWKIKVNGYGMIMSSIISNLDGKFKFINKLTFLKRNGESWDVLDFAIWQDSGVDKTTLKNEEIEFNFGKEESFSFKLEKENTDTKQLKNTQEYKKLARWFQGSKEQGDEDKFLGHWNINVDGKNSDIWQNLEELIKNKNKKFASDLIYRSRETTIKWFKNEKLVYDFTNFDNWNSTPKKSDLASSQGKWVDILEECINKNSKYKDLCPNK